MCVHRLNLSQLDLSPRAHVLASCRSPRCPHCLSHLLASPSPPHFLARRLVLTTSPHTSLRSSLLTLGAICNMAPGFISLTPRISRNVDASRITLGRGDCDDGDIIRCETLCPTLPRRTLRCDEIGARTNVVDHQRDSSTADGETLVTRPAVHGTSADRQLTQHSTSSTSQLHQPSPSDDSYRDPSDGEDAVMVTMTEQLSTSRSEQVGGATGRIYVPGNSSGGLRDEPGRDVTIRCCSLYTVESDTKK